MACAKASTTEEPDAEDRTSGGVGGVTGAILLPRPDPQEALRRDDNDG